MVNKLCSDFDFRATVLGYQTIIEDPGILQRRSSGSRRCRLLVISHGINVVKASDRLGPGKGTGYYADFGPGNRQDLVNKIEEAVQGDFIVSFFDCRCHSLILSPCVPTTHVAYEAKGSEKLPVDDAYVYYINKFRGH